MYVHVLPSIKSPTWIPISIWRHRDGYIRLGPKELNIHVYEGKIIQVCQNLLCFSFFLSLSLLLSLLLPLPLPLPLSLPLCLSPSPSPSSLPLPPSLSLLFPQGEVLRPGVSPWPCIWGVPAPAGGTDAWSDSEATELDGSETRVLSPQHWVQHPAFSIPAVSYTRPSTENDQVSHTAWYRCTTCTHDVNWCMCNYIH